MAIPLEKFLSLESDLRFEFGDKLRIKTEVPSKQLTTFGLGADVPLVVEPENIDALCKLLYFFKNKCVDWKIIGAGSNIILPDAPLNSVIIRLGKEFLGFTFANGLSLSIENLLSASGKEIGESNNENPELIELIALGSTSLMTLSRKISALGFTGLEFAAGIPASLGGAVKMNAGAHHHQLSEIIDSVLIANDSGVVQLLNLADLNFDYRKSSITTKQIVLGAKLKLRAGEKEEIKQKRTSCLEYRKKTQPLTMPSAGSVFKNPIKELGLTAGEILDQLGFKGKTCGGVQFSELHANWLVRISDEAKASDAIKLIESAQIAVQKSYSTTDSSNIMVPEIVIWN